jgi:uncharacterized membrane protein YphA (DoxX/SURF4 family)
LQRLFSTFPEGRPGTGLLFLRLCASIVLINFAFASPSPASLAGAVAGILLLAGLWTPIAGAVIAFDQLWIVFQQPANPRTHILLAALGVSLAMLGPGAWSVDARLFGRKRLDIGAWTRGHNPTPPK